MTLRFRTRTLGGQAAPLLGEFRMINKGKGRPSGLPSPIFSQLAPFPHTEEWSMDALHQGPPFKDGGPFFNMKKVFPRTVEGHVYIEGVTINSNENNSLGFAPLPGEDWRWTYKGGFSDPQIPADLPPLPAMAYVPNSTGTNWNSAVNPDDLNNLGNRGWKKLRPDPARASLMQSVFELREAPRMLQTSAKVFSHSWKKLGGQQTGNFLTPKELGDQFLNHQFGWKPFVKDVWDVCDVALFFSDHVARAFEQNGKWQKRYFAEPIQTSDELVYQANSSSNGTYCSPSLFSFDGYKNLRDPLGFHNRWRPDNISIRRQSFVKIWYEGRFRSYRPEFDKGLQSGYPALDKARQFMSLAGFRVNATTLYKVTPWTWLIDWFAGVGDAVQRYEDMLTDTVASEYFYLMRTIESRYEYTLTKQTYSGPLVLKWYSGVTTKRRAVGASAFGFSASPGGLSGAQMAILAALGMSKLG